MPRAIESGRMPDAAMEIGLERQVQLLHRPRSLYHIISKVFACVFQLDFAMTPDFRAKAALLRMLGHPVRLSILLELAAGPKCVTDIQELVRVQQANVSQHLSALRHEGLVDFHEEGKLRCYYIARPSLARAILRLVQGDFPAVSQSKQSVQRAAKRRRAREAADGKPGVCNAECKRDLT
jgi:ArsR family transcriptional regulator, arsenate/arsenite/antimonite-responsive transcriptional repressor